MASSTEIAAYRATHSVADTAAQFNVSERRVYQACKAANIAVSSGTGCMPLSPVPTTSRSIIPKLGDVADGVTEWRDPVRGRAEVADAGVIARDWYDKKDLQDVGRLTAPPVSCASAAIPRPAPAPAPAPVHVQTRIPPSFSPVYAGRSLPVTSERLDHKKRRSSSLLPASAVNPFGPSLVERVHPLVWIGLTVVVCLFVFGGL